MVIRIALGLAGVVCMVLALLSSPGAPVAWGWGLAGGAIAVFLSLVLESD